VWASSHRRREIYVGWPTVKAIYGEKVAAGYADKYLAKFAYTGQETDEPVSPDRPDNLFEPAAEQYGAHGIFDERASDFSPMAWIDLHRGAVALGAAVFAGTLIGFMRSWRT
jgi:hypothetical protein